MLSDEVIAFFELRGYQVPRVGLACAFQTGYRGTPGHWQVTLYDPKLQSHIHETGSSAVEAVSAMVRRLGGETDDSGRRTGGLEALSVAMAGLRLSYSIAHNARR